MFSLPFPKRRLSGVLTPRYEYGSLNDLIAVHSRRVAITNQVYAHVGARLAGLTKVIRQLTSAIGDSGLIKAVDVFLETIESCHVGHGANTACLPVTNLSAENSF